MEIGAGPIHATKPGMRDSNSTSIWIAVAFALAGCFAVALCIRGARKAEQQEKAAAHADPPPLPTLAPRK